LRDALQALGFAGPVIALDRVERQAQPPGAVHQPDVVGAQAVDLVPALPGCVGALSLLQRGTPRPAGGVGGDFLAHGLAEVVPQVQAVPALARAGQRPADRLAIGPGAITARYLHLRVPAEPLLRDVPGPTGQHVHAPAILGVNDDRGIDEALPQGEVIDPDHPWRPRPRHWDAHQGPQRRVPRQPGRPARTGPWPRPGPLIHAPPRIPGRQASWSAAGSGPAHRAPAPGTS